MTDFVTEERVRFHLRFGWWSLLASASFGVVLEGLHAFKVGAYLDVEGEVRRLMWTLAHAHGGLLALLHIALAATFHLTRPSGAAPRWASLALATASVLLPGGFLLGGLHVVGADPGLGVLLVPFGALALLVGIVAAGWSIRGARPS